MHSPRLHDWFGVLGSRDEPSAVVDSRPRMMAILGLFVLAFSIIMARAVWLEIAAGEAFREVAAKPIEWERVLPAQRGRIVTRDGVVLAEDRAQQTLSLHYRYIEWPPNERWLRRQAYRRLASEGRRGSTTVSAEMSRIRAELVAQKRELAHLSGLSITKFNARCRRVQQRIERISQLVNDRRHDHHEEPQPLPDDASLPETIRHVLADALTAPPSPSTGPITIAEELQHHEIATLTESGASEIMADPDAFPGVQVVQNSARAYPRQRLAANLIGHLGVSEKDDAEDPQRIGMLGLEKQFEFRLRGRRGREMQTLDRRGHVLSSTTVIAPKAGADVRLTIDSELQHLAESLLASALARRLIAGDNEKDAGGALVVIDVETGELLVAASAPRFDPSAMESGDTAKVAAILQDERRPLIDRVTRMAIAPGSLMKIVTASALIEQGAVTEDERFACRGYLEHPDRLRCSIYRQYGVGHGEISLYDALAQSCNVYFFHHADKLGGERLVDWSRRFGLGEATGIELPSEQSGSLPSAEGQEIPNGEVRLAAVGQGQVTATPLQMARVVAAVANGGMLVRPRVVHHEQHARGTTIPGLHATTLLGIRQGMQQAVIDPHGTAHAALSELPISLAVKTGTAQTARGADHAWIAGFAPAHAPRWAFVVALEHSGSGAGAAGPVIRRLLERMEARGLFEISRSGAHMPAN